MTASSPVARRTSRAHKLLLAVGIALATLLAYAAVARFGFINFDDGGYVTENDRVKLGLRPDTILWSLTTGEMSNWHPLTWLSYMLDAELFGATPGAMHVENVLFHTGNALLLFALLDRLTGRTARSAMVAALFALHPAHVESVAWISERKDVVSTMFWLLTTWEYARYTARPTLGRYVTTLLLFALGLATKPMLVTLPMTLLLLDYWPLGRLAAGGGVEVRGEAPARPPIVRVVLEKIPLLSLAAVASVATFVAQAQSGAMASIDHLSLSGRVANALVAYARYLGLLVWPVDLAVLYPHPGRWPAVAVAAAATLVAAITVGAALGRRRAPYVAFGWLFFLGTLVPVIGLVQVGEQSIADRYTYVPFIGLSVAVVWGLSDLAARLRALRPLVVAAALGCVALLAAGTRRQVSYWRDSLTLFEHALAVTEHNAIAHDRVGSALNELGRYAEAGEHFRAILAMRPRDSGAHCGLGLALYDTGHPDEAIVEFRKALRLRPAFPEAHGGLAFALQSKGELDDAIEEFAAAARLAPSRAEAQANLGNALLARGRAAEAIATLQAAVELSPRNASVRYNLANAVLASGDFPAAIGHYQRALELKPSHALARNNLGIALARAGHLEEGAAQMRRALELDAGLVDAHVNLAAILDATGRHNEALAELRAAVDAARRTGRHDLAKRLEAQLQGEAGP